MKREKYTIADVAKALNVSRATISRAINGKPGVGEDLRQKILSYVEDVGYQPNSIAQSLSRGSMKIISLILGDIRNPFYADLAFNIQQILSEHGYLVMVLNSEYDVQRELDFISMTEQFNFAGLILITAQDKSLEEKLENLDLPVVLVNRILAGYKGSSVLIDNYHASYMAVMHLIEQGHRDIGFVAGQANSSAANQRYGGFRQALENYQIPFNEEFLFHSDLKLETGYNIGKKFVERQGLKPSAMVIMNDMTAIGFIGACKEGGVKVPEELSVISFDDIEMASVKGIELTTVSQHVDEMGRNAAQLLLKQLDNPEVRPERIILEPTLIVRNTTAPYSSRSDEDDD